MPHNVIQPLSTLSLETLLPALGGKEHTGEAFFDGDMEALLERFLMPIVALAGAKAGVVRVMTDDAKHMRLIAQQGLPDEILSAERLVHRDCGVCGLAIGADTLAWIDDVRQCGRGPEQHQYFGGHCRKVLAISLTHGGAVYGVYTLFFDNDQPLAAHTESMLRLIGQLLGMVLHNASIERERLRLTVLRERQEMVNEVHDAIAQTLAYVRMRLPLLSDAMLAHDDQRSLQYFSDVKKAVGEVHVNLREVMTYFRTRMDPQGLLHALSKVGESYYDRTGISLEIRNEAVQLNLSEEQEVQIFYIVQEALANIAKHSLARNATITICQKAGLLEFIVEDDGLGMTSPSVATIVANAGEAQHSNHLGLEIMRSRAQRVHGKLEVCSNQGGGTRVCLTVPASHKTVGP
jgi:two-component system nitrate/nitrite sensor histidine kinase NarX